MEVKLSKAEKSQLDNAVKSNSVHKWFSVKDSMKFEVGDVFIKHRKGYNYNTKENTWEVENINSDNKMAQRYVYVYEDQYGVGYFKQLKVSTGTLSKELYCMTDFDFEFTKFEIDPEYAEHVLLDADFDIKSIHKKSLEARKIVIKMNRKIGMKPKKVSEFNKFFDSLKPGDTYYTSQDFTGKYAKKHIFRKIVNKIKKKDIEKLDSWSYRRFKEKYAKSIDSEEFYVISYNNSYGDQEYDVTDLFRNVFYKTKPVEEEKKT